jgi:type 1 glutamine amidotransferase
VSSAAEERGPAPRRPALLTVVVLVAVVLTAGHARPALPRLLMVTHSAGYEHEVVRRPVGGGLSTAERVVADLGHRSGRFEVTHLATRAELAGLTVATVRAHQALLFFTTGELPLAPTVRQAIFQRVHEGAGFVGVHSATDTWYAVPEYRQLVGATFDGHPWHGRVRVVVEDRTHPATRHLGDAFEIADEIYQFRDWSRAQVHVLLRLDPRSVDVGLGKRLDRDYALAWSRRYGEGRVVYTALGHEPAVWADERFRAHLLGAIEWVLPGL